LWIDLSWKFCPEIGQRFYSLHERYSEMCH
jgi:hypothetical protein